MSINSILDINFGESIFIGIGFGFLYGAIVGIVAIGINYGIKLFKS